MVVNILSRQITHPAGRADWILHERPREVDAALGQLVEIGRLHLSVSVDPHTAGVVLIGFDNKYIGFVQGLTSVPRGRAVQSLRISSDSFLLRRDSGPPALVPTTSG